MSAVTPILEKACEAYFQNTKAGRWIDGETILSLRSSLFFFIIFITKYLTFQVASTLQTQQVFRSFTANSKINDEFLVKNHYWAMFFQNKRNSINVKKTL